MARENVGCSSQEEQSLPNLDQVVCSTFLGLQTSVSKLRRHRSYPIEWNHVETNFPLHEREQEMRQ